MNSWYDYFINTKNNPPRQLLVEALPFVISKNKALDLGSGALNDSKFLLSQGFKHITALDKEPVAQEIVEHFPKDSFTYCIHDLETYVFPENTFDLVNAQYTLPFIRPEFLPDVWNSIFDALKQGGIVTGQFFGINDSWANRKEMNFQDSDAVKKLLAKFETVVFREEEKDSATAAGNMKHWHVFHFIVRKNK